MTGADRVPRRDRRESAMPGRNGARCALHATGPTPAAAAVRDAERLVQVEMRDVGAEVPGRREADERVQVRAVDVDLAAVRVTISQMRTMPARTRRASTDR
jgi:hypothetical protein